MFKAFHIDVIFNNSRVWSHIFPLSFLSRRSSFILLLTHSVHFCFVTSSEPTLMAFFLNLKCDTCNWGLNCKKTAASSLANSPTVSLNAQTVCVSTGRKRPLVRESAVLTLTDVTLSGRRWQMYWGSCGHTVKAFKFCIHCVVLRCLSGEFSERLSVCF